MKSTHKKSERWHILGAGSIGLLWGVHLSLKDTSVRFIVRTPQRLAEFSKPLAISGKTAPVTLQLSAELANEDMSISRLLVTTKSYDCLDAVKSISHRLTEDCVIVLMQNGLGQHQQVSKLLPGHTVYAATTTEGAYRQAATQLTHAGSGESWIGPINSNARLRGKDDLNSLFELPLKAAYDQDINQWLWQKLAINAAINGLTAKHGCCNGELASNPLYFREMEQLCREVEKVTQTSGQLLFAQPLIEHAQKIAEATSTNYSSMLQDVRNGRRTEIDFINGFICRQAAQQGIDVPYNQALVDTVLALR
ncbi:MAG: 2-dehydropantoate 2-reductase [Motiliproteus sp.]